MLRTSLLSLPQSSNHGIAIARSMGASTRRHGSRISVATAINSGIRNKKVDWRTALSSSSQVFSSLTTATFQQSTLRPSSMTSSLAPSSLSYQFQRPLLSVHHSLLLNRISQNQKRSYIFLPSSFKDLHKSIANLLSATNTHRMEIVLKLRETRQSIRTKLKQKQLPPSSSSSYSNRREKIKKKIGRVKSNLSDTKLRWMAKRDAFRIRYANFLLRHSSSHFYLRRRTMSGLLRFKGWMVPSNTYYNYKQRYGGNKKLLRHRFYDRFRKKYLLLLRRQEQQQQLREDDKTLPMQSTHNNEIQQTDASSLQVEEEDYYRTKKIILNEPSSPKWFDKHGYPLTSRDDITGRFVNPWNSDSTDGDHGIWDFIRWRWNRLLTKQLNQEQDYIEKEKKKSFSNMSNLDIIRGIVQESGFGTNNNSSYSLSSPPSSSSADDSKCWADLAPPSNEDTIKLTWIGHSTTLIQQSSYTLLTDPIFSKRASPLQSSSIMNSFAESRYVPPACTASTLPDIIDVVLLSHDHYDHLDYNSICELADSKKVKYWVVPLGMKKWLMDRIGIKGLDIVELEWWESVKFIKTQPEGGEEREGSIEIVGLAKEFSDSTKSKKEKNSFDGYDQEVIKEKENKKSDSKQVEMVITSAPAQHWCSRTPFDRNRRLWCSWAVRTTDTTPSTSTETSSSSLSSPSSSSSLNFYFAGDTGLPQTFPLHRQIGDRLGPFQLSALPIGAYEPSFFMRDSHCNPKEAVKMHLDLKSEKSVAIHWGTFALADERYDEPPLMLKDALREFEEKQPQQGEEIEKSSSSIDFVVVPQGDSVESHGKSHETMKENGKEIRNNVRKEG